ncbi:hypothetical protein KC887_06650 [Candidatus Kaiserbacteria bacterium]|nr:hypothetical protein [Candidatus Kaiserbacteria bacterium]
MAEETTQDKQDGQKTLVSFIVGLLIGGMLVWAFSGPSAEAPKKVADDMVTDAETAVDTAGNAVADGATDVKNAVTNAVADEKPTLTVGEGSVTVKNQPAGNVVTLESATYPVSEGWVGVRQYDNGELGRYINGVVRFSESQGLVPQEIVLQSPTIAGHEYAIVIFAEDGDFDFSLSGDVQIDKIFGTFKAE